MTAATIISLGILIFAVAILYASVGHAGASGYLAAMALFGVAPDVMRPTAQVLNIMVASLVTWKFYREGLLDFSKVRPFVATSAPLAFLGGGIELPGIYYRPIVGLVLLFAAARLLFLDARPGGWQSRPIPRAAALASGAAIGLLSGLTGVGGGIFLSPLVLFTGWVRDTRDAAGMTAPFILINSSAGLLGQYTAVQKIPLDGAWLGLAAIAGGVIGAELGSRRLKNRWLNRILALVLGIAAIKFAGDLPLPRF